MPSPGDSDALLRSRPGQGPGPPLSLIVLRSRPCDMPETVPLSHLKGELRGNGHPSGGSDPLRHPERVARVT